MESRFVDFEGIHGSGKTACAWNLYQRLKASGREAQVYFEYDMDNPHENPCDLQFLAVLGEDELLSVIDRFPAHRERLLGEGRQYGDDVCIYWGAFRDAPTLTETLKTYGAYGGRLESAEFMKLLRSRVRSFVESALAVGGVYLFENVLLQQPLNELLRFSDLSEEELITYVRELVEVLSPLRPTLFYLQPDDLRAQIDKVASERLSDNYDLYPDWIDWMVEYVKNSRYGLRYGVRNREDLMAYFLRREELEKKILASLTIRSVVVPVGHKSYEAENEEIYREAMK